MAILAQCPICRTKQSVKNRKCNCGEDLVLAKRSRRVRYWIHYRLPGGKQRSESVGYSIKEARDAEGKRHSQKRENRIFDILPESRITFNQLSEWYLSLASVRKLASYSRIEQAISCFNSTFGERKVNSIKPVHIENYQEKRLEEGKAPATVDMEVKYAQTAVTKAFDNDKIDGRALKSFRRVKRKLKKGANARKRTISFEEYVRLIENAPPHLKAMIIIAFNTGMRAGEIRSLKWKYIEWQNELIRMPSTVTKESKPKNIPMNHHVQHILREIPRSLLHDYVISYRGRPIMQKDGYKKSFRSTCKKAEVPYGRKIPNGITFHDIRRTVKTNMLSAGIDKVHRDLILGHSLNGMDMHYMFPSDKDLKNTMNRFTDWIDSKLNHKDSCRIDTIY